MIEIVYTPWSLRGVTVPTWQVYVFITESHDLRQLAEVKKRLNNPPEKGVYLVENSSPAIRRLHWKQLDNGVYFRVFN